MGLILASASPRRQALLQLITSDFRVIPADTDETIPPSLAPAQAAPYLASRKANAVSTQNPNDTVLGADTTVLLGAQILGKPLTAPRAVAMLRQLSGKTHQVVTGIALQKGTRSLAFSVQTDVTFYDLTEAEIQAYVATGEPFDKAGGYGIQGTGALLVREIQGDYYNVVGLPIALLARKLAQFNRSEENT